MITEKELNDTIELLLKNSFKSKDELVMFTGKNGVRAFAKSFYNKQYSFAELLGLFRLGVVKGSYGSYTISSNAF